jgi:prophage regulatory protein
MSIRGRKVDQAATEAAHADASADAKREAQAGLQPQVLSIYEVCMIAGLSRSSVRRYERAGHFPPRIRLGPGRIGYLAAEVFRWVEDLPRSAGFARDMEP